jgi:N,N'-diacetyllegionaminate synthase
MRKVLVIAEAGVNHNGRIDLAFELVDAAVRSGADIVKFQTGKPEQLVCRNAPKAEYQRATTGSAESQFDMIRRLMLSDEEHAALSRYCADAGIEFLSTPFDLESVDLLKSLGIRRWKIPSGEITNLPLLRKIGSFRQEVIMSTGMANLGEIEVALGALEEAGTKRADVVILHCTTEYPAPVAEVNLRAMETMGRAFGTRTGYSDHTIGIAIPLAAAALGASVIEKHFTLDRQMEGPDHKASLEPRELAEMVAGIRAIEEALGDGIKRPSTSELKNKPIARKSIVAARNITAGETLTADNITTKRPGTGLSPMIWDQVIGRSANRDYLADEEIEL